MNVFIWTLLTSGLRTPPRERGEVDPRMSFAHARSARAFSVRSGRNRDGFGRNWGHLNRPFDAQPARATRKLFVCLSAPGESFCYESVLVNVRKSLVVNIRES